MSYIKWTDDYSVGVKTMDEQHKRLIDLINEYYEGIMQKKNKEALAKMMQGLLDYTKYHFGDEEKLMLQSGYAKLPAQKNQHEHFVNTIRDYQKRIDEGKMLLSIEITGFLKDWLVRHIQGEDKAYGPFMNAKGIR